MCVGACVGVYFVNKWFFVFISRPPFKLERRGWGEFPVRVELHLITGKIVNVIHNLKVTRSPITSFHT